MSVYINHLILWGPLTSSWNKPVPVSSIPGWHSFPPPLCHINRIVSTLKFLPRVESSEPQHTCLTMKIA